MNLGWNIYEKFSAFRNQKGKQILRLGEVNSGIGLSLPYGDEKWFQKRVPINTLIGKIPAGKYRMSLELRALAGKLEIYSCLNLFFVEFT